jgi:DNA helicase-2/ATP-dependent DNA helicase PcrA
MTSEPTAGDWVNSPYVCDALILAPPGCGKTEILAQRARALARLGLLRDGQVLALAFANKAAQNMQNRFRHVLGPAADRLICVSTFHSFAYRLIRHHGPLVTDRLDPQRGHPLQPHRRILREVIDDYGVNRDDLSRELRSAKMGLYTDEEVVNRISSEAARAYETRLRAEGCIDYDDAIRLGLLLVAMPTVVASYQARFRVVMVDEVQDLTVQQFNLFHHLAPGATVFAGDRAQGIYGFAGADPASVYGRIASRPDLAVVQLSTSYRSSAAVLRVVNETGGALGAGPIECASDSTIQVEGSVRALTFANVGEEADYVIGLAMRWLEEDPSSSVGILSRVGFRAAEVRQELRARSLPFVDWSTGAHPAHVVERLQQALRILDATVGDDADGLNELYYACTERMTVDDPIALDELTEAVETIREDVEARGLRAAVSDLRPIIRGDAPTPAGIHVLNAHTGKGQQFDHVIIVGLEDDMIPYYRSHQSDEEIKAELAVLHVMVSRARKSLIATVSQVRGGRRREPSRWLDFIERHCNE